jgi:ParB-like chromosome segregation protein Spo0J
MNEKIAQSIVAQIAQIDTADLDSLVATINTIRAALHEISPFRTEPVDFVKWVRNTTVYANDYNPNNVAPPEMELLRVSIEADGYTQPIVAMPDGDGQHEVIDGFHRHRVGKEADDIRARVRGYLPIVMMKEERRDKADRMAATIRHNRARGKHAVNAMSDIVIELKRRNWTDNKIAKNLGMEPDEVLRLCQISGLSELFADQEFSKSWDVEHFEESFVPLSEEDGGEAVEPEPGRILHTWDKWECYPAGFYEDKPPKGLTREDCEETYRQLLADIPAFENALMKVVLTWPKSCEHYLTNERMNRIAWLGQASLCVAHGIPSTFRGGYNLLTLEQQKVADAAALRALNFWFKANGRPELSMDQAQSTTEANLY